MNKAKRAYLIVIWTITLIAICVGLAIHVGGFIGPFAFFSNAGEMVEDTIEIRDTVTKLDVNVDLGSVEIISGDNFSVSYNYPEKFVPNIRVKNEKLTIEEKNDTPRFGKNDSTYCITITIPEEIKITDCNVEAAIGEINITDVDMKKMEVSADIGTIDLKNVKGNALDVEANMGEIDLKSCSFNNVNAKADMGDITLDGDFNIIEAFCDMGDIDITTEKPTNEISVKAECELGDAEVNGVEISD